MVSAIRASHPRLPLLPHILRDVVKWNDRPGWLAAMAYEWCSVIYENYRGTPEEDQLLLLSLEIGFRNLDPRSPFMRVKLTHTEHHRKLADVVFRSADDEAIADLLQAWTSASGSHEPLTWLKTCARHLINLRPPSSRLRQLVIRSVGLIGYNGFEEVGVEGFVRLLDGLRVSVGDMDATSDWTLLLLDVVESSEGARRLSHPYWELLAEVAALESPRVQNRTYTPQTTAFLEEAREWEKLERWISVVCMLWPPDAGEETEEDLERAMVLLSHNRPGIIQDPEQQVRQWSREREQDVAGSFQRAREVAQRDGP